MDPVNPINLGRTVFDSIPFTFLLVPLSRKSTSGEEGRTGNMKGGGGGGASTKRRWRGLVVGVLGLVVLSMLVPLVFLLGFYNGFQSPGN